MAKKRHELFQRMVDAWENGNQAESERLHQELGIHMWIGCPLCMAQHAEHDTIGARG